MTFDPGVFTMRLASPVSDDSSALETPTNTIVVNNVLVWKNMPVSSEWRPNDLRYKGNHREDISNAGAECSEHFNISDMVSKNSCIGIRIERSND